MMNLSKIWQVVALIAIPCFLTTVAWSQEARGTITGTIADPFGALSFRAPLWW